MEESKWKGLSCFSNRVNVWLLDIEHLSEENGKELFCKLPRVRQQKVNDCKVPEKKKQSFGAGVLLYLLCRLLQEKYGFTEKELEVQYILQGKPVFAKEIGAAFSLSHAKGCVALAFTMPDFGVRNKQQLGIDIEPMIESRMAVAKRFFTQDEYAFIVSDQEKQKEFFFRIWTGKEAVIKQSGEGLKIPLNSFSVLQQKKDDLFYTDFACGENKYAMTVCMNGAMSQYEPFLSWVDCDIL